jgi:hypothetical protein
MSEDLPTADNYLSARSQFLEAANSAGADLDSYRNSDAEIDATQLFLDVASLGGESADNVLVISSGVHGVEGFTGSAVQTALLNSDLKKSLPDNTGVLMIHAINPFGFAHLRRVNEDNIDLNRNFVEFSQPLPDNSDYDRLADVIAPMKASFFFRLTSLFRILMYQLRHGQSGLQKAVAQGQYSHPDGLFYGGCSPAWSRQTLEHIVEQKLAHVRKLAWIDIHTGLGSYGHGELIMYEPKESHPVQRAQKWWGEESVRTVVEGNSVSTDLNGTINRFVNNVLPDAEVTIAGLEFGTFAPMKIFRVLQEENRLSAVAGQPSGELQSTRVKLLRAFCPDDESWREGVWQQSKLAVENALAGLGE